jgi:hypothetical protein
MQKMGGVAALIGAATNLLALVVFAVLLAPKGFGSADADPSRIVALLVDNQAWLSVWYAIQHFAFGVCLIILALALYERLQAGSPALAQAATIVGLIWAVLVIVIGTLIISDLNTVVRLYGENPAQAATVWSSLKSVEDGLGGGGGETMVNALWFLLLGWAALQARALPRALNYLGVAIGVAGVLSVVLASLGLMAVYGLGLIIWLAWLGVVMLRGSTNLAAQEAKAFVSHPVTTEASR